MSETDEEMMEDEEELGGGAPPNSAYSSVPSSPPGQQKRPLSSTSSRSSPPQDLFRKKTRGLPNIYNCHGCGLRFPDKGRRERLQPLDSQWRIVLLCNACLRAIRSAEVCSYCFVSFAGESGGSIGCRRCSARVHFVCLPKERGYLAASDLDPDSFVCVDCWVFPTSPIKRIGDSRGSCATRVGSISLEDVVRSAKCAAAKKLEFAARAKEKAVAKAIAAKRASELARSALDLVVVVAEKQPLACTQGIVTGEKVASQVHRAMNGSHRRISKNSCSDNTECFIDCKGGRTDSNLVCKDSEYGNCTICVKVELCSEDTLYETLGPMDAKLPNVIASSEGNHHLHIGVRERMDQINEANKIGKDNPEEVPASEEPGSCSDMLVNSTDDRRVDSVSSSCPGPSGPNTLLRTFQLDEKHYLPDRYLKKYCKRSSRMKVTKKNEGSASLLVPVSQ